MVVEVAAFASSTMEEVATGALRWEKHTPVRRKYPAEAKACQAKESCHKNCSLYQVIIFTSFTVIMIVFIFAYL